MKKLKNFESDFYKNCCEEEGDKNKKKEDEKKTVLGWAAAFLIFVSVGGVFCIKYVRNLNTNESTDVASYQITQEQRFFESYISRSKKIVEDDYFNDVVFVGDSVTAGIKLYQTAKNALVLSKTGLNVTTISNPIEIDGNDANILDVIQKSGRKKIYVMLGSNGIGWLDDNYMIRLYCNWLNQLRQKVPGALIFVQSVLPITKELSDINSEKENLLTNEKILSYNLALQNMCTQNKFYFLDVASEFRDEWNALPDEASPVDGIHINAKYYNLWLSYIKSHTI